MAVVPDNELLPQVVPAHSQLLWDKKMSSFVNAVGEKSRKKVFFWFFSFMWKNLVATTLSRSEREVFFGLFIKHERKVVSS